MPAIGAHSVLEALLEGLVRVRVEEVVGAVFDGEPGIGGCSGSRVGNWASPAGNGTLGGYGTMAVGGAVRSLTVKLRVVV